MQRRQGQPGFDDDQHRDHHVDLDVDIDIDIDLHLDDHDDSADDDHRRPHDRCAHDAAAYHRRTDACTADD